MKFLEERRRREGKPGISALLGPKTTSTAPAAETKPSMASVPPKLADTSVPKSEQPKQQNLVQQQPSAEPEIQSVAPTLPANAQDVWRFTDGQGILGKYTVARHTQTGTVVELWHDGAGSFAFRRAPDATVKYCSSYGSMREFVRVIMCVCVRESVCVRCVCV
jgi:hypothetical protein